MDSSPTTVAFPAFEVASKVLVLSFSGFLPLLIDEQGDEAYGKGAGKVIWAYSQVVISVMTILCYLGFLGILDYGRMKRKTLYYASASSAIFMIFFAFSFSPSAVILSAILVVLGKTCQRIADVAFESLIDSAVGSEQEAHELTSRAQATGFAGILGIVLTLLAPVAAIMFYGLEIEEGPWLMYIVPNVLVGVWSLAFVRYMNYLMPEDLGEGIELDFGTSAASLWCTSPSMRWAQVVLAGVDRGLKEQWANVQFTKALPDLRWLYVSYIFLNGAGNTVSSVAAIIALNELEAPLWVIGAGSFAGLATALGGLALFRHLIHNEYVTVKQVLFTNMFVLALAALYSLTIRTNWELILLMGVCGSQLGCFSSYSRSLVSTMVPGSHQSRLFSLFELVKDGTAWIGPLVIAQLVEEYGEEKYVEIVVYTFCCLLAVGLPTFAFMVDVERGRGARLAVDASDAAATGVKDIERVSFPEGEEGGGGGADIRL